VDEGFLVRLHQALSRLGADVRCFELTCSDENLERRVASVERSRYGKVSSAERFRELRAAGAFPRFVAPPDAMTVDTSGMSVSQAVASVSKRLT
jgi:hypothetical protein